MCNLGSQKHALSIEELVIMFLDLSQKRPIVHTVSACKTFPRWPAMAETSPRVKAPCKLAPDAEGK